MNDFIFLLHSNMRLSSTNYLNAIHSQDDRLATDICRVGRDLWLTCVSLIYFYIVEMYLLDRVRRQFGAVQRILQNCEKDPNQIYRMDPRRKGYED